jgi:dTDP-4-amino-4,6-dideoxygalactose transaminase
MKKFIPRRRYVMHQGELTAIFRALLPRQDCQDDAVSSFEAALAHYHGVAHAHCVNSGRIGLLLLLEALGAKPGDEIVVPAYTYRALIVLLAESGYVPVPVDIDPVTFNLDPGQVRARLGPRTRAILATHLFGQPCDMASLQQIAQEHALWLLEDCAQAFGSEQYKRKVGSFGDGAILSFDLLKSVNTFGGGAVLTPHAEVSARIAQRIASMPAPGIALARRIVIGLAEHAVLTTPLARVVAHALAHPRTQKFVTRSYRSMQDAVRPAFACYTALQAGIGLRLLDSLDARVAVRRTQMRLLGRLLGEKGNAARGANGYFFVRQVTDDATALRRDLLHAGVDAGIGHEVADYCGDLGRAAPCPVAQTVYRQAIQLPLHEGVTDDGLRHIANICAGRLIHLHAPHAA